MSAIAITEGEERLLRAVMVLVRTRQELERLLAAPGGDVAGSVAIAEALSLVKLGSALVCNAEVGR